MSFNINNNKQVVVLVNDKDEVLGVMDKMEAHQKGVLHRAISVILFNDKDEVLLQQRSLNKYHSAGKWSNTCCSHPYLNELPDQAAFRRLQEEMGISIDKLYFWKKFMYFVKLDNELNENELDYIFIGRYNLNPSINTDEVMNYKYESIDNLKKEVDENPDNYTYWFKLMINELNLHNATEQLKKMEYAV